MTLNKKPHSGLFLNEAAKRLCQKFKFDVNSDVAKRLRFSKNRYATFHLSFSEPESSLLHRMPSPKTKSIFMIF